MEYAFALRNVNYRYNKKQSNVLNDISFNVKTGTIFGLLGPSGAGKSTTQKVMIKLLNDFEGEILYFGKALKHYNQSFYEEIGVGFEMPVLFNKLTAMENLSFFASLYKREIDYEALLIRVGLGEAKNQQVGQYSKGMKVRLNFVRALVNDPKVVFLDEPTNGLDPTNARIIKDIILELKAAGKTIFISTHLMGDVEELCDEVAFIAEGKVLEIYESTTYPSALNSLILDGITFEAFYPSIRIQGDQPNMTMIELFNLSLSAIVIGTDTDTFAALESIDISNVSATSIQIGQRATSFPVLTELTVNFTTILGDLRIGDESSTFPLLEELYVTNSTFTNLKIGRFNDEFAILNLIYLENITLSGELIIASIVAPELAIIVLNDITASSLSISPTLAITETYVVYIDNLVLSSTLYFNSSCNHIYLVESDVTTWAYYAAVNALGIAMSNGTYVVI